MKDLGMTLSAILLASAALSSDSRGDPLNTAFTYQGRLEDGGQPANGQFDMIFRVFGAPSGGIQYGGDAVLPGTSVANGLFTVTLDFGAATFYGSRRWLEIEVQGEVLVPRQELTAAPYAAFASAPWAIKPDLDLYYTNGRVGIGTTTPTQALTVAGKVQSTSGGFVFPDGSVQTTAAGSGGFWSSSGSHISNTNAGNVGIGTTAPQAKLDVNGMVKGFAPAVLDIGNPSPNSALHGIGEEGGFDPSTGQDWLGGIGLKGESLDNIGVLGVSTAADGVKGESTSFIGVVGVSQGHDGVHGLSHASAKSGVSGYNDAGGFGVNGASTTGTGVSATSGGAGLSAPALRVQNTHPAGVALWSISNSSDGNLIISNGGGGSLIRGFNGGCCPVFEVRNDGRTVVSVLEVTGADVAEKFPSDEKVAPGTLMEIDPDQPGRLRTARGPYNARVAGVVSGAGDLPAGAVLGNLPGHEDAPAIALSGRVWALCDASDTAINPGDLLTTSNTPGHAMTASDRERSHGAIIGKAMSGLERGRMGLVLVLVNLQ